MPQTSSTVEARLAALAAGVEAEETGLRVIAARPASLPYVDLAATLEVREARQFNVLEAFILRAAHELVPAPTLPVLAAMLGLDPLFVNASSERLVEIGALTLSDAGTPVLTAKGRDHYLQGQLPPTVSQEEVSVRYWAVSDRLVISDHAPGETFAVPVFPGFVAQSESEQEAAAVRALKDLRRLVATTEEAGLGLHQPDEGQTIHAVSAWDVVRTGTVACAILVVQETLATGGDEDTLMLRVVALSGGRRHFEAEAVLRRWMTEGRVTLRDLLAEDAPDGEA